MVTSTSREAFLSRRSVVFGTNGAIATSQPMAARIGLRVLECGGNAVDAAVSAMAVLGVLEPMWTGVGGDAFAIVSVPGEGMRCINGSGPAGSLRDAEYLRAHGVRTMPSGGEREDGLAGMCVTVPGAVAAWSEMLNELGTITLDAALRPAERLAADGFPVSEVAAWIWGRCRNRLLVFPGGEELLVDGRAPRAGELIRLPTLAQTLRAIRREGPDGLYQGSIGMRIAETIEDLGGAVSQEDLATYKPEWVDPISETYGPYRVYQCPPNGQGVVTLMTLRALAERRAPASPHVPHRVRDVVDELGRALGVARRHVADPRFGGLTYSQILDLDSPEQQRDPAGDSAGDTAYVAVIDGAGVACSLINSLYQEFGSGAVVPGTGIALHNRGALFSLEPGHPNELQPGKRPYHTIIPSIVEREDGWLTAFGVVGGFRQPQAQVQILLNIADLDMDPQSAIEQPRFGIDLEAGDLVLEPGFSTETIEELAESGCRIRFVEGFERGFVGSAQMVSRDATGVLAGASDPRKDGLALAF